MELISRTEDGLYRLPAFIDDSVSAVVRSGMTMSVSTSPKYRIGTDGPENPLDPGEYTAALTLNYAVDDGTVVSHLEPLVIENVKFKVGE